MSVATLPPDAADESNRIQPRLAAPNLQHSVPEPAAAEPQLKVCVLAACPFPANHGTPGSIRELAEATAERGHEVHIVSYHFGDDLPLKNVRLHRVKDRTGETEIRVGPTKYRPLYDYQMIWKTIEVVRKYDIDLIHAHSYEAALAAGCAKPFVRRPILYSAHCSMGDELASYDFFSSKRFANGLAWVLDRTVPRLGDRCLPHSTNLHQFLHDRGLESRTEPVLNFGIDIDALDFGDRDAARASLGIGDEPVVMYTGVSDHFQRLDLLLGAMTHVHPHRPDAKVVVVSSIKHEEHEKELWEEARRLGIEDRLMIHVPENMEEGLRLLSAADVTVVPRPAAPGFPIKLLNYMAASKPTVMFASSASRVVHGEHVWLAGEDTAESLGQGIALMLGDDALRCQIAEGGHRFVRHNHDRRAVAQNLCAAYQRLVEPTRRWAEIAKRPKAAQESNGAALSDTINQSLDVTVETMKYSGDQRPSDEVSVHAAP